MEYTVEQLKHKTVVELREIAKGIEHEAVQGYTQLNKEHLLVAISKALGIQHEHHEVVGVDKAVIKSRIRELKKKRDEALTAHDHAQLKTVRRTHSLVRWAGGEVVHDVHGPGGRGEHHHDRRFGEERRTPSRPRRLLGAAWPAVRLLHARNDHCRGANPRTQS